jgi:hypothetical protein
MGGDAPTVPKRKKSKNVDSRLKISGMTKKKVVTPERLYCPLFVTPAIFKPGSTVFKSIWIPDKSAQA